MAYIDPTTTLQSIRDAIDAILVSGGVTRLQIGDKEVVFDLKQLRELEAEYARRVARETSGGIGYAVQNHAGSR